MTLDQDVEEIQLVGNAAGRRDQGKKADTRKCVGGCFQRDAQLAGSLTKLFAVVLLGIFLQLIS